MPRARPKFESLAPCRPTLGVLPVIGQTYGVAASIGLGLVSAAGLARGDCALIIDTVRRTTLVSGSRLDLPVGGRCLGASTPGHPSAPPAAEMGKQRDPGLRFRGDAVAHHWRRSRQLHGVVRLRHLWLRHQSRAGVFSGDGAGEGRLIATFATLAAAFAVRPFDGFVFGLVRSFSRLGGWRS